MAVQQGPRTCTGPYRGVLELLDFLVRARGVQHLAVGGGQHAGVRAALQFRGRGRSVCWYVSVCMAGPSVGNVSCASCHGVKAADAHARWLLPRLLLPCHSCKAARRYRHVPADVACGRTLSTCSFSRLRSLSRHSYTAPSMPAEMSLESSVDHATDRTWGEVDGDGWFRRARRQME